MVDFQSRDTRRSETTTDEASDPDDEAAAETAPAEDGPDATEEQAVGSESEDGVIAVLATSGASTDVSTAVAEELVETGYDVCGRDRRAQNLDAIQTAVDEFVDRSGVCAVVTVGGTGVGPQDRTVEAVQPLLTKALPGFGETFRRRWGNVTGETSLGSRATAGIADDTPVFCLPDDADAVAHAARELVGPQAAPLHRRAGGT